VSRFHKLSHTIWHCQYHIVWVPKYRFRVLHGAVGRAVEEGIQAICVGVGSCGKWDAGKKLCGKWDAGNGKWDAGKKLS
jgi:Transposase IS200 like